jgi:KUP system potassium uptake protein
MEHAYGLSIILAMMMDTLLFTFFLFLKRTPLLLSGLFFITFFGIENSFLIANLHKLVHGGWVTLTVTCFLIWHMYGWSKAREIRSRLVEFIKLGDYLKILTELSQDTSIPKYATHLVYMSSANNPDEIERKIAYSILQKQPKRADIYWFVHVDVMDEPYTMAYRVTEIINDKVIRINFKLGFRIEPRINILFRQVVEDLVANKEVDISSRYYSLSKNNVIGDFRFIVIEKYISNDNVFNFFQRIVLANYSFLKLFALNEGKAFGLDTSLVTVEKVPLVLNPVGRIEMKRLE